MQDIFDKIKETESGVDGEIQLTDALTKLDEVYGVLFECKTYNMANRLDWIGHPSNSALKTLKGMNLLNI